MEELTLTTPALLFSAVSLILLAYTNRFLSYAQLVRQLRDRYVENPSDITEAQIENLRKRLNLTRTMQGLGIASLFLCVVSMFLIYIGLQLFSAYVFGLALILLIASLGVSAKYRFPPVHWRFTWERWRKGKTKNNTVDNPSY